MAKILLISVNTLKERTVLHDNVDEKLIYPEIEAAQDLYILPLLGTALYKKMLSLVGDNSITAPENAKYKELLDDYLVLTLCYYVLSEIPDSINYQFTNKGVVGKTSDNSDRPSMSDMYAIVDKYKNRAESYQKRAQQYLRANAPTYFLEYLNPGQGIDVVRPHYNNFTSPIYLGPEYPDLRSYEERYQGNNPLYP